MKKIIALVLCFIIGAVPVFAEDTAEPDVSSELTQTAEPETSAEPITYTLSLDDAIKLALTDNPQLTVLEIKQEAADIALNSAFVDKANSKHAEVMFGNMSIALVKKGYGISAAQSNIRLLELQKKQQESKIAYDVTDKYFKYILADRLVQIANDAEKLALENKATTDKYFELGMVAEIDVKNMDANIKKATFNKESSVRNRALAEESLKIALNIEHPCNFILTDNIEFSEFESDVAADIIPAMESRYDVNGLMEAYMLQQQYFEIIGIYNLPNTAAYNNAQSDLKQSEFNYTNNKRLIGLSIKSIYNSILTAKDSLTSAQQGLEIKQLEYDIAKIKYEVGSITNTALNQAQNALSSAMTELENAKLTYKLAVEKYQYEITIGL